MEGKCPKCGINYRGWALRERRHQFCARCGAELEIKDKHGLSAPKGTSPSGVERKLTKSPTSAPPLSR